MTRVIFARRAAGKAGDSMTSLNARCGSAVMRQMVASSLSAMGCGRAILDGFRRFLSTMCFLVVRVSQMGVSVAVDSSSSRRDGLAAGALEEMCLSRALEAFRVFFFRTLAVHPLLSCVSRH
jgi:hypothetical protein